MLSFVSLSGQCSGETEGGDKEVVEHQEDLLYTSVLSLQDADPEP